MRTEEVSRQVEWLDVPDPTKKLLRIGDVCELVGLSRSMIYKCMKDPEISFPTPLKIGTLSRWDQDEIHEWARRLRAHS